LDFHPYFDIKHNLKPQSCKRYASAIFYHQGNPLVLISVRGWVEPRATECGQKEEVTSKFPRTLLGIESGTSRLVA